MYEYKNDEKLNNIGFARIEARNNQCKVFIHINMSGMDGKLLKAYMFYRRPTKSRFAYLGNVLIQEGLGELKVKSDRNNVMNSDLDLEDVCGVIIYKDRQSFVACEWDEQPITHTLIDSIENLDLAGNRAETAETENGKLKEVLVETREQPVRVVDYQGQVLEEIGQERDETNRQIVDTVETNESETYLMEAAEVSITEEAVENQIENAIEDVVTEIVQVPTEQLPEKNLLRQEGLDISNATQNQPSYSNTQLEWITNMAKNIQELFSTPAVGQGEMSQPRDSVHESAAVGIQLQNSSVNQEDLYTNLDYYKNHNVINQMYGYRNIPYEQKVSTKSFENECFDIECVEPTYGISGIDMEEANQTLQINECAAKFECHPIAQNIFRRFPRVYPFEDNEIFDCVRIEPQDIGLLPIEAWVLGNNSFLLHGYYTYRHLIFGKIMSPNGFVYVVGVPGIYHSRESFMARMFGFEHFKCAKLTEQKDGEFGYYYLPIQLD